ncbi:MAG: YbjN domain-containing protein [Thermoguttaceae bacterium]|jgi:hypothetical protein
MNQVLERLLARDGKIGQPSLNGQLGVTMLDGYEGRLSAADLEARVTIELEDWVHVAAGVTRPPEAIDALRRNYALPGNLRFARTAGGVRLLADTQLDGFAHLAATFAELKTGLVRAVGGPEKASKQRPDAAPPDGALAAALARLGWDEERLLKRDDGWELRVRSDGRWHSVVVVPGKEGDLHCYVPILTVNAADAETLAVVALQLNNQLRFARYALADDELLAESRLHGGLFSPNWIQTAARAVAVAASHARRLRLLAECPEVRAWCERVFLSQGDDSGTEGGDYNNTGSDAPASETVSA